MVKVEVKVGQGGIDADWNKVPITQRLLYSITRLCDDCCVVVAVGCRANKPGSNVYP
jgi:hypothetical protein